MQKTTAFILPLLLVSIATAISYPLLRTAITPAATGKIEKRFFSEQRISDAKNFVSKSGFNEDFCFLMDLSLPSGQPRFFVYDLKGDSIRSKGLVTHGNCNQEWLEGRQYGNEVGCGCSSLGKYKIGYAYTGRFGLAFKLYGLDSTNSHAFDRYVVLHSHSCVPDAPIDDDICQSNGCPTVAPAFLKKLEPLIKNSAKPVLLWIMNGQP